MTSSDVWDADHARHYDEASGAMFSSEVLGPTVDRLAELAGDGPVLEFAVGTGRVAVPLHARGVPVTGIELSRPMVDQLRRKLGPDELPVTVGDMASTPVEGRFALVFLVFNTIGNLRTQDEQVACFRNAARHLEPGGRFVVEVGVPPLRQFPPGALAVPFDVGDDHVGFDTFDLVTQQATSHHLWATEDGPVRAVRHNYRYVWPAELDLMARLAGMVLESRHADWSGAPFSDDSTSHVSVWRRSSPVED